MMITLMLAVALITIGLLTVLPAIKQQVLRDREEEMRHRGTEYMRAIQHFYRALGRYPSRLEDLENTNNRRYLRRRYTDPLSVDPATGKQRDFKLLRQTDVLLNNAPVLGQTPGQSPLPLQPGGGIQPTGSAQPPATGNSDSSSNTTGDSNSTGSSSSNSNSSSGLNGQTFGGAPIIGVASTSKAKSIRVFYQKDHYKDWLFIYLPQADRGGLLVGPVNPGVPTTALGGLGGMAPGLPASGAPGQGPGTMPNTGQTPTLQTQPVPDSGSTPPN